MMMTLLLFYLPHRIDVDESHGTIPHRIVHDRKQQLDSGGNQQRDEAAGRSIPTAVRRAHENHGHGSVRTLQRWWQFVALLARHSLRNRRLVCTIHIIVCIPT